MPPFLTKQLSEKKSNLRKVLEPHVIRVLSALIVILLFLLFYRISPFIFQTNDDLFLKMIVSGELTGTPDPHMFYIAYPTGLLLSGLYKLFPHFPWYGLFFCFTIGLTMTIILSTLLKLEEKLWTRLTTVFLFCLVSYGFLFLHIAELQFTTVTAIIVSLFLIEKLAYHRADWKTFSAYTEASEAIYDYEGYPDYDTYAEIYGELGITRSSYEAAAHHYCIILDPAVNQRTMETLEAIIKQERRLSLSELPAKIRQMAAFFIERHLSYTDRPLNILVYCCYILFKGICPTLTDL